MFVAFALCGSANAIELLTNAVLDISNSPPGWELQEFSPSLGGAPQDAAELVAFAAQSGTQGLWLKAFNGLFFGNGNESTSAILSQSATAVVGDTYTFTGYSRFESNYSGGITTLNSLSPSGAALSPTSTYFRLAFLDAAGAPLGSPTTLDLRTVQTNGSGWLRHTVNAVAPAGAARVRVTAAAERMVANIDPFQSAFFDDFSLKRSGASTTEILSNSSLEIPPPAVPVGWNLAVENPNPSAAYFGSFAAHAGADGLYIDNGFADITPQDVSLTQTVPGAPGGIYTFSGWSYFYGGYSGGIATLDPNSPYGAVPSQTRTLYQIEFLNSSSSVIASSFAELRAAGQRNDSTWRKHSVTAVAPEGTTQVRVSLKANDLMSNVSPPGDFQGANFDDFSLTVIPEPATALMLILGGAFVCVRQRRAR
jgi:hypothetical protein